MSREVRRVPGDWEHPIEDDSYRPLFESGVCRQSLLDWFDEYDLWRRGVHPDQMKYSKETSNKTFSDWYGIMPNPDDYMPDWPKEECTHYQMYETTTEGTPISPVMKTPEQLARWLTDVGASAFGNMTASYDEWLHVCKGAYAPSMILDNRGVMLPGVCMIDDHDDYDDYDDSVGVEVWVEDD